MKPKLLRITTVPISLDKLIEGQLAFMKSNYEVIGVSSGGETLEKVEINDWISASPDNIIIVIDYDKNNDLMKQISSQI